MKFGQQLELNTFPEWSRSYIRYRQLKTAINQLYPTRDELKAEAKRGKEKTEQSLLKLTDPKAAAAAEAASSAAAAKLHSASDDEHHDDGASPGLSPSPSSSTLFSSPSPHDTPDRTATPDLRARSAQAGGPASDGTMKPSSSLMSIPSHKSFNSLEQLPIANAGKEYGGLEDEPLLSGRAKDREERDRNRGNGAPVQVQLNGISVDSLPSTLNIGATHGDVSLVTVPPSVHPGDSPVRGNPHIGRSIARRHFAKAASVANLRSSDSSEAHLEKLDSLVVKILAELQKVDEFHKSMEAKILLNYESTRRSAMDLLEQRLKNHESKDRPKEGIMKRLKLGQFGKHAEKHRHQQSQQQQPATATTRKEHAGSDASDRSEDSAALLLPIPPSARSSSEVLLPAAGGEKEMTTPTLTASTTTMQHSASFGALSSAASLLSDNPSRGSLGGGGTPKQKKFGASSKNGSFNSLQSHTLPPTHSIGKDYHPVWSSNNAYNSNTAAAVDHKSSRRNSSVHDLHQQQHTPHLHHGRHASDSSHHEKDEEMDALPLRGAFIALLRKTTMLIHYVDINYVAAAKLLKCLEKRTRESLRHVRDDGAEYAKRQTEKTLADLKTALQGKNFYTSRTLDAQVLPEIYRLYADLFEGGNLERGKLVLLSTMTEQQYDRSDTFWLGIKIGVILMLLSLLGVILVRPVEDIERVQAMGLFAPCYRGIGLLIIFMWLWSFLVWIWDTWRIPYVLIFQLNPRTRLTHFQLQTEAANLTIVYLFNSLMFLTGTSDVNLVVYPLTLFLFVALKFFSPTRLISQWNSRSLLLSTLGQIVIAPFGKIRFLEGFVADVLTSMVKIWVDVEASLCIFLTWFFSAGVGADLVECAGVARVVVPIICALPLWWRFMQCLRRYYDTTQRRPHLPNALKYFFTHSVVIMGAYHPIFQDHHASAWQTYRVVWLLCCVVSTLYSTWWDIAMDWGLLTFDHADYPLLRRELVFRDHAWVYYFAIVSNFFLRWVWVITIIPFSFEDSAGADTWTPDTYFDAFLSYDQIIVPTLGILELLRRFQWSILRVEYEQIVQGTHLRVDAHLPVFIQQHQKSNSEKKEEEAQRGSGILTEVVGMVIVLLVVAVIAALT